MSKDFCKALRRLPVLTVLLALGAGYSRAQSINGRVYDPTGGVVRNARVMLMQDYVKVQEIRSGDAGEFSFTGLQPGMYQVQIKHPMMSLFQKTVILKDAPERVYAVLPLAHAEDSVEINAQLPPGVQRGAAAAIKATRAGGRIEPAKLLVFRPPAFPAGTVSRGVEGAVVLIATMKVDGILSEALVLESPDYELEQAALESVKKWRYQPMKLNGQPVEGQITIILSFRLQ
jgi:TonB family protein